MKSNTHFIGTYECPQEDTLAGPFWGLDEEVLFGSLYVYQRDKDRGYPDFGAVDHV